MKQSNKPDTDLYLHRELFNSLITALDYFIASESEVGESVQSQHASRLKQKILTHGRAFDYNGDDNASIYLYGVEPAVIIKLLTIFINRGEIEPSKDYYSQLKKRNSKTGQGL
jgi:hypothetical protein